MSPKLFLNNEQKQRARSLLIKAGIIIALGAVYYVFVSLTGVGVPCTIRAATGLQCPGCGVTRMCVALVRLDFYKAFEYNPVIFCALPFLSVCVGAQIIRYIKTGSNEFSLWQNLILWTFVAALAIFGIVRNLI